jgi:hypothetical protein
LCWGGGRARANGKTEDGGHIFEKNRIRNDADDEFSTISPNIFRFSFCLAFLGIYSDEASIQNSVFKEVPSSEA